MIESRALTPTAAFLAAALFVGAPASFFASQSIRRAVLSHGLISSAYNTAILVLVVTVVASLLH